MSIEIEFGGYVRREAAPLENSSMQDVHPSGACLKQVTRFVVVVLLSALCQTTLGQVGTGFVEKPHPSDARLKDFEWLKPVITLGNDLKFPKITSLMVTLGTPPAGESKATDFSKFERLRSARTRDVDLLGRASGAIAGGWIRLPQKKKDNCDWLPVGELELNLGEETVRILMGDGFTERHMKCIRPNQVFFSKPLAKLVDHVLRKEFATGLTEEQFQRLSGEWARRQEQEAFADDEFGKHDVYSAKRQDTTGLSTSERLKNVESDFKDFPASKAPAQWEHFVLEEDESIVALTLNFTTPGSELRGASEWLNITAVDAVTLKRAERGLRGLMLRMPKPGNEYAGIGPTGTIVFRTSKLRSLQLSIIPPMTIDGVANPKSFCRSWTLAKVINDMVLRETGTGLTAKEFRSLGGDLE